MFAPRSTRWNRAILELGTASSGGDKPCSQAAYALVEDRIRDRLDPAFPGRWAMADGPMVRSGAGDLNDGIGAAQVEIIGHSGRISEPGRLSVRGEARPAYKRAFDAQLAVLHRPNLQPAD